MAKAVYICVRDANASRTDELQVEIEKLSRRICPDNISPRPVKILRRKNLIGAIFSPSNAVTLRDTGICLGKVDDESDWCTPGSNSPDGSFVIFRENHEAVEILTDVVASRSVWYYFDDNMFIAATSQRVIVSLLGSFEFNSNLIPWMLTTGSHGPVDTWDRRIRRIGPDTILRLSRESWTHTLIARDAVFEPGDLSDTEYRDSLRECLQSTVGQMQFDYSEWALPLSGGYDSRTLFYFLRNPENLQTITWGLDSARTQFGTDAAIAEQLTSEMGNTHRYMPIDLADEPIEAIFNRFIVCGEGGIDHISGYMDGFGLWQRLYDSNITGIIRGDTTFTAKQVSSPEDVLHVLKFYRWDEYANLPHAECSGIDEQEMPKRFHRREYESLPEWRDRLMRSLRIPVVIAALNDLKSHYVEIANPLLYRPIIDFHSTVPDDLRTEKALLKMLLAPNQTKSKPGSSVPFAQYIALSTRAKLLGSVAAVDFLRSVLKSKSAHALLPDSLLQLVDENMGHYTASDETIKRRILNVVSPEIRQRVKRMLPVSSKSTYMNFNVLAFRIFIICKMHSLLTEDAGYLQTSSNSPS